MSHTIQLPFFATKKSLLLLICSLLLAPTFEQKAEINNTAATCVVILGLAGLYAGYRYKKSGALAKQSISIEEYQEAQKKLRELPEDLDVQKKVLQNKEVTSANLWKTVGATIDKLEQERATIHRLDNDTCIPCRPPLARFYEYCDKANTKSLISYIAEFRDDKKICSELVKKAEPLQENLKKTVAHLESIFYQNELFPSSKKIVAVFPESRDEYNTTKYDPAKLRQWKEKYSACAAEAFKDSLAKIDHQIAERKKAQEIVQKYQAEQSQKN